MGELLQKVLEGGAGAKIRQAGVEERLCANFVKSSDQQIRKNYM
jgi:hypothetical protein